MSPKLCAEFEHMTLNVLQKFKVKGSKVKVTPDVIPVTIYQIINYLTAHCPIALKINTEFWKSTSGQTQDGGRPQNF